ncbi:MAG: NAD(P)H-dependent oxidoreductase [Chloroflexi bacterium]|nr:NAD(P)H-dependent oxidoreductase [Chloroflexota bacterium]
MAEEGQLTAITAILGSVTPPGRLSTAVRDALARAATSGHGTTLLDLGQLSLGFADGRPLEQLTDDTPRLVQSVQAADAVLLATPIYRATLTGALKNALDLLPLEALRDTPVGIVSMGATLHHFLGAESHLRDILAWFGAITAPTAVYLSPADFVDGKLAGGAAAALDELIASLVRLTGLSGGGGLGPAPLAAGPPKG